MCFISGVKWPDVVYRPMLEESLSVHNLNEGMHLWFAQWLLDLSLSFSMSITSHSTPGDIMHNPLPYILPVECSPASYVAKGKRRHFSGSTILKSHQFWQLCTAKYLVFFFGIAHVQRNLGRGARKIYDMIILEWVGFQIILYFEHVDKISNLTL